MHRPVPPRRRPASDHGRIEELHLFTAPVAFNLDGIPGPDGFEMRIYASSVGHAHGVVIGSGNVEVTIYDGLLRESDGVTVQPLHTWTFTASEMRAFSSSTSLGIGYRLMLRWGADKPTKESFTVIVRYQVGKQPPIASSPNAVAMATR